MMNSVNLVGRLTDEVKVFAGEKEGCSFSLAVQETKEKAHFFNCSAWNHTCTYLDQYAKKGALVAISGRLTTYKDKNGVNRVGIVVNNADIIQNPKPKEEK